MNLLKRNLLHKNHAIFSILLLSLFVCTACSKQALFHEYQLIDAKGWADAKVCSYDMDILDMDETYDMTIGIRHKTNYPYQNLWLFVETTAPDQTIHRDTVFCALADHTGKWHAKGSGSIYTFELAFKSNFRFEQAGHYQYKIRHGMRDEILEGVHAVGLKLMKANGKE